MSEHHWLSRVVLLRPERVAEGLERVARAGLVERTPNTWQITLGVLRMWHRVLFRPESIGTSREGPRPATRRARWLERRALRFPFLLAARAVAPLDFSGLCSSRERIVSHLLGAHHDAHQFGYDLELLAAHPGALPELLRRASAVVSGADPRAAWLRDLVVYPGYHEHLLAAVQAALQGDPLFDAHELDDPDVSFRAYLRWCAAQPATPEATLAAWRRGALDLRSTTRAPGPDVRAEAAC